jgi:hypothetical protein
LRTCLAGDAPILAAPTPRPAALLESIPERRGAELTFRIILGVEHQHADPPHPLALLRARR